MDDGEIIKLVERVVQLEGRVAELEKRHATREVIGQVRGLEQHAVRRLEALEGRAAELEGRVGAALRSGLLSPNPWTRTLTVGAYVLAGLGLVGLGLLILWGLMILAALLMSQSVGVRI